MKRSLLYLMLVIPALSFAQSNFQKGYIISNSKDTLRGYINYKERIGNPSSVVFKSTLNAQPQTFTVVNSGGYGVDQQETYQRYIVNISSSTANASNLHQGLDSSYVRDTVFLKVLQSGKKLTLFSFADEIKTRYYLQEQGTNEPYELLNHVFLGDVYKDGFTVEGIVTQKRYTRQMRIVMDKYDTGSQKDKDNLRYLDYGSRDLIKTVALINEQQMVKSTRSHIRFFAGGGLNIGHGYYSGSVELANNAAVTKRSYLPMITTGIDIFGNPAIGKLVYRIELSVSMAKGDITTTTSTDARARLGHSFDQFTAALTPQVIYNFYNTNQFKIFGGFGLGLNISSYSNNKSSRYNSFRDETSIAENEVEFEVFNASLPVVLGITLHRKVEFSVGYVAPASLTNYIAYGVKMQRVKIGVNYLFGSH
jgi:hypothetical protein